MKLSVKLCVLPIASFVLLSSLPVRGQTGEALTKKCAAAKQISFEDASARASQKGPVEVPPLAKQLAIKGVVRIETCVSETGEVILTKPAGGSPILVVAALDSAKKWRFQPLVEGNQSIPFKTVLEISFLQGSTASQVTKENQDNDVYFKAEDICRKDLKEKQAGRAEEDCKQALALVAKLPDERQNERRSEANRTTRPCQRG